MYENIFKGDKMNCACNRYQTCTECRNAYKETVKRERQILDVIKELERPKVLGIEFTTGELLDLLYKDAEEYIKGSKVSILRNTHMNELTPKTNIPQEIIDAVVVDFINFVGGKRGCDVGMYTKYLRKGVKK